MVALPYSGLSHTYEDEAVGYFYCLKKESSTIYARVRRSHAYSYLATWHYDRVKGFLSLNMSYSSQLETQSRPSHSFLECQILPPDFLVVLQLGNRPSKAHLPFLQDIRTVTQGDGKFRILLTEQDG
jgi:hypothetical protein